MQVSELKSAIDAFKNLPVTVVIPSQGQPHALRGLHVVGHLHHPGETKTDPARHVLDLVCDAWDSSAAEPIGPVKTTQALAKMLGPYPDEMHVRIAVPIQHDSHSHRMLDIATVGHAAGTGSPATVQLITEDWANPMQVVKELPAAVKRRLAEPAAMEVENG